jgi:diadenosine tetraphosphate (Ap4A) HIT family hydrolase
MDAATFSIDPQLTQTSYPLVALSVSDLRLVDDSRWPWILVIPRVPHTVELIDLSPELRNQVRQEIDHVSRVLRDQFAPDKLNVAALGNQVRQLHIHVIARYRDDAAWPKPVWGVGDALPYESDALNSRLSGLRQALI